MPYSYISMHTQALYWSCIELIKDVHLIHKGKVPNAMCTYSIYRLQLLNLSKVFIKIYNTIWYIHSDCLHWFICTASGFFVYYCKLPTRWPDIYWRFLSFRNYALFFDRITNWKFNRTCILDCNLIILPVSHRFIFSTLISYIKQSSSRISNFTRL